MEKVEEFKKIVKSRFGLITDMGRGIDNKRNKAYHINKNNNYY